MVVNNRLLWLPDALRGAGLTVHEIVGWQDRGHADDSYFLAHGFDPLAVIFHHDGSPPGDSPGGLSWLINGFGSSSDTNYDAQCWVDRYGVWFVIAAGYAQHAGAGTGWGAIPGEMGNPRSFGVETDHTTGETWPAAQLGSVRIGMAAICKARGWDPAQCVVGHKEYAPGRKDDPDGVDMPTFRREVAAVIAGGFDDMSAADVTAVLNGVREMLRLPSNGLAVPRGQTDNGNLAAILVGMAQSTVLRDQAAATAVAGVAGGVAGLATDADGVLAAVNAVDAAVTATGITLSQADAKTLAALTAMSLTITDEQIAALAARLGIDYDRIAALVHFDISTALSTTPPA